MVSRCLKTTSFVLYGIVTFLLLVAVLVLIFKDDDRASCGGGKSPITSVEIANLLNDTTALGSATKETSINGSSEDASGRPTVPPFDFTGHYELYDSENFDEFLTELGLGYFKRLAATRASSQYFISKQEPDTWTLRTVSTFGESTVSFRDGIEFSEDRLDGVTVRSIISIHGNKWVQKQFGDDIPEVAIVREFEPPGVKVTSVINGVASIRRYRKIN